MNKQTDFKIGKTYRIAKRGIHCFEPGTKVRILNYYDPAAEDPGGARDYMLGYDELKKQMINVYGKCQGTDKTLHLEQWVKPEDLVKKRTWRKELLRADKSVYLVRYTVLRLPFLRIRLHHILLSDNECCHDHPWSFWSLILKGKYKETREYVTEEISDKKILEYLGRGIKYNWLTDKFYSEKWHGPGSLLIRKATDIHRLELDTVDGKPKSCWTLVFMGRYKRPDWGFWKGKKFVGNEEYKMTQSCDVLQAMVLISAGLRTALSILTLMKLIRLY